MKKYNRKTKRWETEEEIKKGSLKKSKLCIGKKPHQFILVLPSYIKTNKDVDIETIEEYYLSEERINKYTEKENEKLEKIGIITYRGYNMILRYYKCIKCGKKDNISK